MKRKDKIKLYRIVAAAVLLAFAALAEHFSLLPWRLTVWGFDLTALIIFIIPYAIAGYDILLDAIRNILNGQIFDECFLMCIATIAAFATGEYAEAVFVMLFFQTGELFQSIAVGKSRRSIKALLSIRVDTANLLCEDGEVRETECEKIEIGDIICVKAGEKIPLDGVIIEGETTLNTAALTGESLPRDAGIGDSVLSGCVNESGFIKMRVTATFGESTVSKILKLVEESAANKSKSEKFITKFAKYYTPTVVISALLLSVIPPILINASDAAIWREWIMRAMTFLVISCPCALVISVPMAYFSGIGSASSNGILVKGSNYLDALAKCDTIVCDKTGTLTEGIFRVSEIRPHGMTDSELLALAAEAEKHSNHPIALSIRRAAEEASLPTQPQVTLVREIAGRGIEATCGEKQLLIGNGRLMREYNVDMIDDTENHGSAVFLALDGKYLGSITVSDNLKKSTAQALDDLKSAGIREIIMLSGDRREVAERIADKLQISYMAELLPGDKVAAMEEIMGRSEGATVYVGDGINDAPVIARADVGISMGALGSDAAVEASDIVLMDDDLSKLASAVKLSRRTRTIVIQNIIFALSVKFAALILGAFGIVGLGIAVFADVGVAVIAILNSMRNLKKQA